MDPLSTIAVAADILQALNFCSKTLYNKEELYRFSGGSLNTFADFEVLEYSLRKYLTNLSRYPTEQALLSKSDEQFASLNLQCQEICKEILVILSKVKPKEGRSNKMVSLRKSLIWTKRDIESLTKRL
jgi:ATP-dependent protease HslVU (ClpYQ) peptidase subunit